MTKKSNRKTRQRPPRVVASASNRNKSTQIVKVINRFERVRRRLKKPPPQQPRQVDKNPLATGPNLSLAGLVPRYLSDLGVERSTLDRAVDQIRAQQSHFQNSIAELKSAAQPAAAPAAEVVPAAEVAAPIPEPPIVAVPLEEGKAAAPPMLVDGRISKDNLAGLQLNSNKTLLREILGPGQYRPSDNIDQLLFRIAQQANLSPHNYEGLEEYLRTKGVPQSKRPPQKQKGQGEPLLSKHFCGAGESKIKPLYDSQIDKAMEPYRSKGYLGCIAADQMHLLWPAVNSFDQIGFIINTKPANDPDGGEHWVACFISFIARQNQSHQVCWYNSLADPPTPQNLKDLKELIKQRKDLDVMLKLKINKIKRQYDSTATCGYMSMLFLMRMFDGESFKEASGYNTMFANEMAAGKLHAKFKRFGYI